MASVRQRRGNPADLPPRRAVVEELSTSEDEAEGSGNEALSKTETVDVAAEKKTKKKKTIAEAEDDEDAYSPWLDVLRVISFFIVASCGLSYLISGGETFFWGMTNPPKYLQKQYWVAQFVCLTLLLLPLCVSIRDTHIHTHMPNSTHKLPFKQVRLTLGPPPHTRPALHTSPSRSSRSTRARTRPSPCTLPSTAPSTT